jgi:hypothetical protein
VSRARLTAWLAAIVAIVPGAIVSAPAAAAPIWRLEQPPPPAGSPFTVPLGAPGDLKFWAPNRGLLTVEGNSAIPRGIYSWNGQSWHQLSTVCGGPADSARIAWAGPEEFWVLSEPSLPRAGSGLALCHFKDGQVVGSFSTRVDAADPFRQMLSATCNGPNDCWFGGVGSQDALGARIGAFHIHWDGTALKTIYGPQGRGVTDMQFHQGKLYESTVVGRAPEDRDDAVELAEPEPVPKLIHTIGGETFANDPFVPEPLAGVPANGSELLALDSDGADLWAGGGGAASGPAAPDESAVPRPPLLAHLVGNSFEELPLSGASFGAEDRIGDIAAMPGTEEAMAAVVPFAERRSANAKATVAQIGPDGSTATTRLPASGAGRGSAARIACPAPGECWMVTWGGWLFHYSEGATLPVDTDPNFQGTIVFRPNEAAEQFVPDAPPEDDSQLFAPPPLEREKEKEKRKTHRLPPLLQHVKSKLHGLRLTVTFVVARKAKVRLLAKKGRRTVASSPRFTYGRGRHAISLQLSRENYPTGLAFKTKEVKR